MLMEPKPNLILFHTRLCRTLRLRREHLKVTDTFPLIGEFGGDGYWGLLCLEVLLAVLGLEVLTEVERFWEPDTLVLEGNVDLL